jgi:VWFA-related protein
MKSIVCALGVVFGIGLAAPPAGGAPQQDLPRFRSAVELTSIDAVVLDERGKPISDLKPSDFTVKVDGKDRPVVSAQWVPLATPAAAAAPPAPPEGYSTNENATGGRLILIVVDEANIRVGGTMGIRNSVNGFIDRLQPSDRVAVVGIGQAAPSTPLTADRRVLKDAIGRLVGQRQSAVASQHNIAVSEAIDIRNDMPGALDNVIGRECAGIRSPQEIEICAVSVENEARSVAQLALTDGQQTVIALRSLLLALRRIDAPKTILFVSEGFLTDDRQLSVSEFGALAAAARASIYTLKLDDALFAASADVARLPPSPARDRMVRAENLEVLAAASRGSLFNIVGNGAGVFERIEAELGGYYLLGVDSVPSDKDGKAHPIRVDVARRNVTVRSRRALVSFPDEVRPQNPRESMIAALTAPLPISALPIRVATFSLKGPEPGKLQLLIHADVGADYSASRVVALGYTISDSTGRIVESQGGDARLPPIMNGVPSALQYSAGASLPPGEYSLKLAVVDGDRVGTIEHPIHAALADAGGMQFSDLMVGGPVSDGVDPLQPTVGYRVVFGTVHGYLEAYGPSSGALKATYEIAPDGKDEALVAQEVPARTAGSTRAIFTRVLPVNRLPPGKYVLRAKLSDGKDVERTLVRTFEVATPAVLMTSATAGGAATVADVYLPVTDAAMARPFDRAQLSRGPTLQAFRSRVPVGARSAFDKGVEYLTNGDYSNAEASFKSAINPDTDSTAIIAYLAACYAAAGQDRDAAGAWQTALIDGSDLPEIYQWLGDALLRAHDLVQARAVLEEANAKWPADARFTRSMAMLYATFGQGREAMRTLERYLDNAAADVDALFMGIEWIYNLHSAGAAAHSPAEDLRLARRYADAYAKAKGPQAALVKQWIAFLEKR